MEAEEVADFLVEILHLEPYPNLGGLSQVFGEAYGLDRKGATSAARSVLLLLTVARRKYRNISTGTRTQDGMRKVCNAISTTRDSSLGEALRSKAAAISDDSNANEQMAMRSVR